MLRLEISDDADADLTEILRYGCAMFGDTVGERYFSGFDAVFELLSEFPESGPVSPLLARETRTRTYGSHRIFYRIAGDRLFVGRVMHVKPQIDADLFDD